MIIPRFVILYFGRELPGSTDLVANVGHTLGNALGDDNIGPDLDRVRKQYWAKISATRGYLFNRQYLCKVVVRTV